MDADSASDLGAALMFDFDFAEEASLTETHHSQQKSPTDDSQQNTTVTNFSHQENVEMGSSSEAGSNSQPVAISRQNLTVTAAAHADSEDMDTSLENTTNLAPQGPSAVNPDQFVGTEQAYNPTTESSELQLPPKENNQPQPQVEMVNSGSANLSGQPHFDQESTNQQLLASAPNNLSPVVTSSFNTPLSSAAAQPYFPTVEHMELGASSGSTQAFLYNSNSSQQSQNLIGSAYNLGFGATDTSLGNGTNVQQNQSTFLQSPLAQTPQQYPPTMVEMMPQFGGVPSFNPEQGINSNNSNQLSTRSETSLQNELLRLQGMDSLNLPTNLRADHQPTPNVRNYDFLNNQPALPYQNSFPQTTIGLGINPQPPRTWFSNQNDLYIPLRPPVNQFLAPNVFAPQGANSMQPGSSMPRRAEHSANNLEQLLSPVPVPAENVLNPQSQYSMQPEQSMSTRLQNLQSQSNQVLQFASPNYNEQDPQGCTNSMLPVPSMPSSMSPRPPQFPLHQQLNQAVGASDLLNLQPSNSVHLKNSWLSGPSSQQSSNDHVSFSTLGQMMDTQRDSSFLLSSSISTPRTQTFDLQAFLNQTSKPGARYPTPGSSQLSSSILNSSTQRDLFGGHNPLGATASTFPQLELSLNRSEQTILGRRNRSTSPLELAEASSSSSSSKRPRMSNFPYKDFILKDNGSSSTSQSRENVGDKGDKLAFLTNPFNNTIARPGKNSLYDPLFEGLGLPIDPHLRLFRSKN